MNVFLLSRIVVLILSTQILFLGCASEKESQGSAHVSAAAMHFADLDADFRRFGLAQKIEPWEDGRRMPHGKESYEWWYLDAVLDDGGVLVVWFGDNWLAGSYDRKVSIEYTPKGAKTQAKLYSTKESGTFSKEKADANIGQSFFRGDLDEYHVFVDAKDTGGLGCDLKLTRRVPSYRPGTGIWEAGKDFFAWLVPVPEGELVGNIVVNGQKVEVHGSGYHDHNWGNIAPWKLMRNWWWGRGEVGGKTVVMAELRPQEGQGEESLPLLYVAGADGVTIDAYGKDLVLTEMKKQKHGDDAHAGLIAAGVKLDAGEQGRVTFTRQKAPVNSTNLLAGKVWWKKAAASFLGKSPWYTRWGSDVVLLKGDESVHGKGTLEFMDFE